MNEAFEVNDPAFVSGCEAAEAAFDAIAMFVSEFVMRNAINAENLKRAHALIESGKAKGKIVLAGF